MLCRRPHVFTVKLEIALRLQPTGSRLQIPESTIVHGTPDNTQSITHDDKQDDPNYGGQTISTATYDNHITTPTMPKWTTLGSTMTINGWNGERYQTMVTIGGELCVRQ